MLQSKLRTYYVHIANIDSAKEENDLYGPWCMVYGDYDRMDSKVLLGEHNCACSVLRSVVD